MAESDRASLAEQKRQAVWIAHTLFDRGKTSGTTANISFRREDSIYISRSGSCFGTLQEEDLVETTMDGKEVAAGGQRASKELELHRILYLSSEKIRAVVHTHSPYAVLWSCLKHENVRDVLGHDTPYLDMKLGRVVEIPYAPPGSETLFGLMRERVGEERGYLLSHHGAIVGGYSLMNAFEAIEELEQSAWLGWQLRNCREAVSDKESGI